jgi:hypothetical protein
MKSTQQLAVNAQIVRVYADAVRKTFGPMADGGDSQGEMLRLLLSLADATATCAENIATSQAEMYELAKVLGINGELDLDPIPFRVIDGGKSES